jgi:hypothetical protein
VDEPTEEISPFDVGHTVGLFDGSETLWYLKLQPPMRASPVVVAHIVDVALAHHGVAQNLDNSARTAVDDAVLLAPSRSLRSSPTATSSASSWPPLWPTTRNCSFSTSRSPASIRSASRR